MIFFWQSSSKWAFKGLMETDFLIHMTLLEFQKRGKFSWIRPIWSQPVITREEFTPVSPVCCSFAYVYVLFFYPSHPTQPPTEKFLLNLTLVFFWFHTGCIQTCNLLLSLFFNSFLLHPQAMTFSAHSANAFIPPQKNKKKGKKTPQCEQLCQTPLWLMAPLFPHGKIIAIKKTIPRSETPRLPPVCF